MYGLVMDIVIINRRTLQLGRTFETSGAFFTD